MYASFMIAAGVALEPLDPEEVDGMESVAEAWEAAESCSSQ